MGRLKDRHQQFALVAGANRAQGKPSQGIQWRVCGHPGALARPFYSAPQNPAHARNLRSCNVRPWSMLPHWWNTSIRLEGARNFHSTAGGWTISPPAASRTRESLRSKVFLNLRKTRPPPRARESLSLSCCRGTLGRYGVGGTPSVSGGSQREGRAKPPIGTDGSEPLKKCGQIQFQRLNDLLQCPDADLFMPVFQL